MEANMQDAIKQTGEALALATLSAVALPLKVMLELSGDFWLTWSEVYRHA